MADDTASEALVAEKPATSDIARVDPGERGKLTVLDRAVEHVADYSLVRTRGVITANSTFGRRPSRARVNKQRDHVRTGLDVTLQWPMSAAEVTDDLRRGVTKGMTDSGLLTDSIDIHVSDFGPVAVGNGKNDAVPMEEFDLAVPPKPASIRRPLATPAATPLAIAITLALLAGAAVLIRDALVGMSVIGGTEWTAGAFDALDGLSPQSWMLPAGIALAVVGLLVVLASIKWRARRYQPSGLADDVWVSKSDLSRLEPSTGATPAHIETDEGDATDKSAESTSSESTSQEATR
ncbi:MAG: hypothetical protein WBF79_08795 [Rhodococcus sp. (in: high G+C Gram-positive bacteria)]